MTDPKTPETLSNVDLDTVQGGGRSYVKAAQRSDKGVILSIEGVEPGQRISLSCETGAPTTKILAQTGTGEI